MGQRTADSTSKGESGVELKAAHLRRRRCGQHRSSDLCRRGSGSSHLVKGGEAMTSEQTRKGTSEAVKTRRIEGVGDGEREERSCRRKREAGEMGLFSSGKSKIPKTFRQPILGRIPSIGRPDRA
jgi:hypothetical protein